MSLKIKPSSSKDFDADVPEVGDYFAVCVAVIDLGTHTPPKGYQGKPPEPAHKVFLAWELVDQATRTVVGKEFTASLHEKSKLRQWIKTWRGSDIPPNSDFDIIDLVGKKCLLTIEHRQSVDRTFPNISTIQKLRKGDIVKDAEHEAVTFDLDSGKPLRLPDWLPFLYGRSIEEWVLTSEEKSGKPSSANGQSNGTSQADDAGTQEDSIPW